MNETLAREDQIARARAAVARVCDPEIPVLTLGDLGVLRGIDIGADGELEVTITPTYSGCPAMKVMELDLRTALAKSGFASARIKTVLSPAWTTDWMTETGREKLRGYGIAPPQGRAWRRGLFGAEAPLACPLCGSTRTVKVSEFGSTACKAHWRCEECLEPFDAFKCI